MDTPIERAVRIAGNQSKLANLVGVTPQAVQQWVERGKVPAERCVSVESAVGAQVTRYELNPEVFGSAPNQIQASRQDRLAIRRTPTDRRTGSERRKREAA